MDYAILKPELSLDPLVRNYAGMTDQQAADSLNALNRTLDVETLPTSDIFEAIVLADYTALTAAQKTTLQIILSLGTVKVKGSNTRAALLSIFGAGTATRANLAALQVQLVSRAAELGLPRVGSHHVEYARST